MKNTSRISKCCSNGIPFLLMFLFFAALWFSNAQAAEPEVTDQNIKRAVLLHLLLGNPKALAAIGSRPQPSRGTADWKSEGDAKRSRPKGTIATDSNKRAGHRDGSGDDIETARTLTGTPASSVSAGPLNATADP